MQLREAGFAPALRRRPGLGSLSQVIAKVPEQEWYQRLLAGWFTVFCAGFCVIPGEWPLRYLFCASVPFTLPAVLATLPRLRGVPLAWGLAGFLLYGALSATWSDDWHSVAKAAGQVFWIGYLLVLCCAVGHDAAAWRRILVSVQVFAAAWAIVSVADFMLDCAGCDRFAGFGRHANPNYTASVAGTVAVLSLTADLCDPIRHRRWLLLCQGPLLALLSVAGGRAALLGYVAAAVLAAVLLSARAGLARAALAAAGSMAAIAATVATAAWFAGGWLAAEIGRGDTYRLQIWAGNLQRVLQRPWFGHGSTAADDLAIDGRVVGHHAHNLFLAQAFYGGVVGALLWLAVVVLAARAAAQVWRRSGDVLPLCGLFFLLAVGMVDIGYVIVEVQAIWLYVWIVLGIVLAYDAAARNAAGATLPRRASTAS